MSKKQADYLTSLLGDVGQDIATPTSQPVTPPKAGMTLLARESALARVATGEVKQVTQLLLDPNRVRIWHGNPRHQASLTEETCRDLIDAILAEGGQKVPAVIRRINNDPDYEYEVIAGSRRHWVISWLRANNYPDMMFLAQVYSLDDEAAFRISDIENRARKDVSDFERARTYLHALELHYNGKQSRMAERLRLSKGWLSKMLSVASLPDWVVDAFASPAEIQMKSCYTLAQKIQSLTHTNDNDRLAKVKNEAIKISLEQMNRKTAQKAGITAVDVIRRLMNSDCLENNAETLLKLEVPSGRTALSVLSSNRNGVSVRLHAGSGATLKELSELLQKALQELEKQGKGLRT